MNSIHDLGGMDGFTLPERDQGRILKYEWQRQFWGLYFSTLRIPGYSTGGRAFMERIPPDIYLNNPYYARWLYSMEKQMVAGGIVTEEELANPDGPLTMPDVGSFQPHTPEAVVRRLAADNSKELEAEVPPLFEVGDTVMVKNEHPEYHTRVPRYVRGRRGVIQRHHGVHEFQDHAGDVGQQHLYTVMFTGPELWGSRAHANDRVHAELWDYHLQSAA